MKISRNVSHCILILPVTFVLPKNVSTLSVLYLHIQCAVTPHLCAVTIQLHPMEGELQHTGWVKLNAEIAAGKCTNICGQTKVTGSISIQRPTFPEVFIFQ